MISYQDCHWGIDGETDDRNVGIYILHQILKNENGECIIDEKQWEDMYFYVNGRSPPPYSLIPYLNRYPNIFSYKMRKCKYGEVFSIKSNIQLTLCKDHLSKGGCHNDRCMKLHCCKFFLYDVCKFPNSCCYGHDLSSSRNQKVLESYMLVMRPNYFEDTVYDCYGNLYNQFSIYDLRNLLRQEYPRICKFYNGEAGCKYGVDGTNCMALHICMNYIMEQRCSSASCCLNHDLTASQPSFIFSNLGYIIDERNCSFMRQALQDELRSQDVDDVNEIDVYRNNKPQNKTSSLAAIQNLHNINNSSSNLLNNYSTLQHLSLRQQLLMKKIPDLIVCNSYNFEKMGCPYSVSCPHLHLCSHFVIGTCSYGANKCRKSHKLRDSNVVAILKIQNIDVDKFEDDEAILTEIRKTIRKNKYKIKENMSASSSSSLDRISNEEMDNDDHDTTSTGHINGHNGMFNRSQESIKTTNNRNNIASHNVYNTTKYSGQKKAAYITNQKHHNRADSKINTFVFVDLEATGLTQPRITEVSLVAVNRLSMETARQMPVSFESRSSYLPRVVNKLTLCVSPLKTIEQTASDMTGLSNMELSHQKNFDDDLVEMLVRFISRLEPPTCLVAHSGFRFDFPLLQAELKSVKRLGDLPSDLLCIDSLILFRSLDETIRRNAIYSNPSPITVNGHKNEACPNESGNNIKDGRRNQTRENGMEEEHRTDWWHIPDVEDKGKNRTAICAAPTPSSNSEEFIEQPPSTTPMDIHSLTVSTPPRNKKSCKPQQRTDWWGVSEEEDNLSSDLTDDDDAGHPKYEGDDEDEVVTTNGKSNASQSDTSTRQSDNNSNTTRNTYCRLNKLLEWRDAVH
ncbi:hypothetical protein HELRODRAFT_189337 [Helobdella robusta]|uniref:C3H1-type domain-containing protein n=1 Tax=Helobdella robusta TaxID=6412 RepID=T1FQZ3_HELRO|nr:hypothetical protein HELRODRAFT_189337 [Helobdella robusta]ESN96700.1 hypothetical protein HELRODRAFT_189337 [Helobdella robusta]